MNLKNAKSSNPTLPKTTNEIHQLINQVAKSCFIHAILNDWNDQKPHIIKIKNNFNTACWAFHNDQHRIYLGDLMFDDLAAAASAEKYIQSMLHHEMAHALWTSRKMHEVSARLHELDVPFDLFNLFEDSRIEEKWRKLTGSLFNWPELNQPFEINSPVGCFFAMVFFEGEVSQIKWDGDVEAVSDYYHRCIKAPNTISVARICAEWMAQFGSATELPQIPMPSSANQDGVTGDLMNAVLVAQNHDLGDLDDDCKEIRMDSSCSDERADEPATSEMIKNEQGIEINHPLILSYEREFDQHLAKTHAALMIKALSNKSTLRNSHRPSKRFNHRFFTGNADSGMYRRPNAPGFGLVSVNLFVDCSGSMDGKPIEYATQIMATFNELAKSSLVKAKVFLSSSDVDVFPCIDLPLGSSMVAKLGDADGSGEGLEKCFKANLNHMINADFNFVITDGHITDRKINKAFYQSKGIYTVGMYVNDRLHGENLLQWFDVGLVRSSIENLFSNLLFMLRNR